MVLTAASRFFITGAGVETRMVHTLSGGAGSEKFWTAAFRLLGCFCARKQWPLYRYKHVVLPSYFTLDPM
jgi:hypothetical protein